MNGRKWRRIILVVIVIIFTFLFIIALRSFCERKYMVINIKVPDIVISVTYEDNNDLPEFRKYNASATLINSDKWDSFRSYGPLGPSLLSYPTRIELESKSLCDYRSLILLGIDSKREWIMLMTYSDSPLVIRVQFPNGSYRDIISSASSQGSRRYPLFRDHSFELPKNISSK